VPSSRLQLSAVKALADVTQEYQISESKKNAPMMEISEPKEDRVFHF